MNSTRLLSFVVRFDSEARTSGRVEHIDSGRRVHFDSAQQLIEFLGGSGDTAVDAEPAAGRPETGSACP